MTVDCETDCKTDCEVDFWFVWLVFGAIGVVVIAMSFVTDELFR